MFAFYEGVPTALAEPGIYLYDPSYKKDKTQSLQAELYSDLASYQKIKTLAKQAG